MERLTFEGNYCDIAQCRELPCKYAGGCAQKEVWERRKAYEDRGREPEEILPKSKACEIALNLMRLAGLESLCSYDHLRELAEANKDGRVVVLPCKVGDTIYFARANPILQYKVTGYEMGEASISQVRSKHVDKETGLTFNFTFRPSSIGKTVFLTREEAEKALQEMEGKKDG